MRKLRLNSVLLVFVLSASMGLAKDRVAIDVPMVADALRASGLPVVPDQILVPSGLTARPGSKLGVDRMDRLSRTQLTMRIRCQALDQCIPFLVTVSWADEGALRSAISNQKNNKRVVVRVPPRHFDIRTGAELVLVIRSSAMLASIPVVAVQNGVVGDRIRVRSKDHSKIFRATLINSRTVEMVI